MIKKTETKKPSSAFKDLKFKDIDYKNVAVLRNFLSSRYKILSSRMTGVAAKKQRALKSEIKKARIMGLLPFTDRHVLGKKG